MYYTTNLASDIKNSYNKRAIINTGNSIDYSIATNFSNNHVVFGLGNSDPIAIVRNRKTSKVFL